MKAITIILIPILLALYLSTQGHALEASLRVDKAEHLLRKDQKAGVKALSALQSELEKKQEGDRKNSNITFQLGRICYLLQKDPEAIKWLDHCLKNTPNHALALYHRALLSGAAGDFQHSAKLLSRAVKVNPKNMIFWFWLGRSHEELKAFGLALRSYKQVLKLNPHYAQAWFRAAILLSTLDNTKEALKHFQQAVQADPGLLNAWFNMGLLQDRMGQPKDALASFEKVIQLNPKDWRARAKRIQLFQAMNKIKERNDERESLKRLVASGEVSIPFYCRDQFKVGALQIQAYEYFSLSGKKPVLYEFQILSKEGKEIGRKFALGSFEALNTVARKEGKSRKGKRLFHLDEYLKNKASKNHGVFKGAPDYDHIRKLVIKLLSGKRNVGAPEKTPNP